jgi:hypothetical protein
MTERGVRFHGYDAVAAPWTFHKRKESRLMSATPVVRRWIPALLVVATLVFGVAAAAHAEDVDEPTFYDEVVTEVVESYPEPSASQPEAVASVASTRGLVGQPPPTTWDRVVVSPCMDPEPSCAPLP